MSDYITGSGGVEEYDDLRVKTEVYLRRKGYWSQDEDELQDAAADVALSLVEKPGLVPHRVVDDMRKRSGRVRWAGLRSEGPTRVTGGKPVPMDPQRILDLSGIDETNPEEVLMAKQAILGCNPLTVWFAVSGETQVEFGRRAGYTVSENKKAKGSPSFSCPRVSQLAKQDKFTFEMGEKLKALLPEDFHHFVDNWVR